MNTDNSSPLSSITFTPIGWVESEFTGYAPSDEMRKRPSRIVLRPGMAPGLLGLEAESHILVLFHLHRATEYELQLHPGPQSRKSHPRRLRYPQPVPAQRHRRYGCGACLGGR